MSKFIPQKALEVKRVSFSSLRKAVSHHDKFFKRFYSDPKLALEIVRLLFSTKQLKKFDLSKLKVEKSILKGLRMDLVLSFPLKDFPHKKIKIIILLEHKSKYDKTLFKQVLKYQTLLYETSKETIAVIPVLFYHGKKDWKWPLSFQGSVFGEEFLKKIPIFIRKGMLDYELMLLDTRSRRVQRVFKDESFKTGRVLQLLDRAWWLQENVEELKEILFSFLKDFPYDDKKILAVVKYLESCGIKRKVWEELEEEAINKGLLRQGGYMDIKQEIREEGQQEKQQELILNMLKEKIDILLICKVTGLSEGEIKKLQNGS